MPHENQVPEGAVGTAIQGPPEEQGKMKQFFTDPKNLATMLVLATALTQPKGNRSGLGHGLRSATGALAFRGGLDQELDARTAAEAEAQSEADYREGQISTAQERNRVAALGVQSDNAQIASNAIQEGANRDAAMTRLQSQIDAGIYDPAGGSPQDKLAADVFTTGLKAYYDALTQYNAGMLDGAPNIQDYVPVLPPGFNLNAIGQPDPSRITPAPGAETVPTPVEVRSAVESLSETATPTQRRTAAAKDQRAANVEGRSFVAQNIRRGEITDATEAAALRKRIKAWKDLDDAGVIAAARDVDAQLIAAIGVEDNMTRMRTLRELSWAASPNVRKQFLEYFKNVTKESTSRILTERRLQEDGRG